MLLQTATQRVNASGSAAICDALPSSWHRSGMNGSPRWCVTPRRCVAAVLFVLTAVPAIGQDRPRPEGSREKENDRLSERLIRKVVSESDEDIMAGIIRLMNQVSRRLELDFDAGPETQDIQRRILFDLDVAIKKAAAQRRPRRPRDRPPGADKRRMDRGKKDASSQSKDARAKEGVGDPTSAKTAEGGQADADKAAAGGDLIERRRSWGHLPMREREEIIQGISEDYLERYRAWIERYYRALQESED